MYKKVISDDIDACISDFLSISDEFGVLEVRWLNGKITDKEHKAILDRYDYLSKKIAL